MRPQETVDNTRSEYVLSYMPLQPPQRNYDQNACQLWPPNSSEKPAAFRRRKHV